MQKFMGLFVLLSVTALLGACGPQPADTTPPADAPAGAPPAEQPPAQ